MFNPFEIEENPFGSLYASGGSRSVVARQEAVEKQREAAARARGYQASLAEEARDRNRKVSEKYGTPAAPRNSWLSGAANLASTAAGLAKENNWFNINNWFGGNKSQGIGSSLPDIAKYSNSNSQGYTDWLR